VIGVSDRVASISRAVSDEALDEKPLRTVVNRTGRRRDGCFNRSSLEI
jgi:hypothetical protein